MDKKLTWRQWIRVIALACFGSLALSMRFAMPQLSAWKNTGILAEILWNFQDSLDGTGFNTTFLFVGLIALGVLAYRMRVTSPRALLPVSFLISLIWLMGTAFGIDDTLDALTASPGQVVKSICYVLGTTWLLYVLGLLLFSFLTRQSAEETGALDKLNRWDLRHPLAAPFVAIMLFWLPHLVIAYPGYLCWDAWHQLAEFFGVVAFTANHPPVHTALVGVFAQFGVTLGSGNLGIYLFVWAQALTQALIFAYTLSLMKRWRTPAWLRIGTFCVIILVPYYTDYVCVVMKDNLYAAMFVLFVAECICLVQEGPARLSLWSNRLRLAISILGTTVFRHNGKLVLYPMILAILLYYWVLWRKRDKRNLELINIAICFLVPIIAANLLVGAVSAHYHVEQGSVAEALSYPFQQTARYVKEYGDEVTEEEAQAIRAVLDYDHLAEKYDPRISDPIKSTYNKEATDKDLARYFAVWFKMFFKHPGVYISATINQSYYLVYPFHQNATFYHGLFLMCGSCLPPTIY